LNIRVLCFVFVLCLHLSVASQAQLVQATFSGEIVAETSPGFFSPGTPFSSVITFDTSTPPNNGGQVSVGFSNAILSNVVTIGNSTFNANSLDMLVVSNNFSPVAGALEDSLQFFSSPLSGTINGSTLSAATISLDDTDATAFSTVSIPSSVSSNDFEVQELSLIFSDSNGVSNIVTGEIQALSFQPVPEPSTFTPFLILSTLTALRRRK